MPKYKESLDRMFHALGDGSRRAMVERLARGPASVSELARPFDMALPTVVQHLGVVETAGIVNDMSDIIERSDIHATFVVERSYPVPVSAVWHALSDNE